VCFDFSYQSLLLLFLLLPRPRLVSWESLSGLCRSTIHLFGLLQRP
jgi:hypothetical protein